MRKNLYLWILICCVAGLSLAVAGEMPKKGTYEVTATAIEACSCQLFCPCYFSPEPTGGHHCEFNNAYRFEPGSHWGGVDLSGAKVWISGDLGGNFGDGTTEWAVVTFDKASTPEQRQAIVGWAQVVFPVKWGKLDTAEDEVVWEDGEKTAHAKLASGNAEITLHKVLDGEGKPAMVSNTPYWGSSSNTGFRLAHSDHYFKGAQHSYNYTKRNGFMITFTAAGKLPEPAAAASSR